MLRKILTAAVVAVALGGPAAVMLAEQAVAQDRRTVIDDGRSRTVVRERPDRTVIKRETPYGTERTVIRRDDDRRYDRRYDRPRHYDRPRGRQIVREQRRGPDWCYYRGDRRHGWTC